MSYSGGPINSHEGGATRGGIPLSAEEVTSQILQDEAWRKMDAGDKEGFEELMDAASPPHLHRPFSNKRTKNQDSGASRSGPTNTSQTGSAKSEPAGKSKFGKYFLAATGIAVVFGIGSALMDDAHKIAPETQPTPTDVNVSPSPADYTGFYKPVDRAVNIWDHYTRGNAPYKIYSSNVCLNVVYAPDDEMFEVTLDYPSAPSKGYVTQAEVKRAPECATETQMEQPSAQITDETLSSSAETEYESNDTTTEEIPAYVPDTSEASRQEQEPANKYYSLRYNTKLSPQLGAHTERGMRELRGACVTLLDDQQDQRYAKVLVHGNKPYEGWIKKSLITPAPNCAPSVTAPVTQQNTPALSVPHPVLQEGILYKEADGRNTMAVIPKGECVIVEEFNSATQQKKIYMRNPQNRYQAVTGYANNLRVDPSLDCKF